MGMKKYMLRCTGSCCCFAMSLSITLVFTLRWKELLDIAEAYDAQAMHEAEITFEEPSLYDNCGGVLFSDELSTNWTQLYRLNYYT